jgi:RHS repeat-associated protein
MARLLLICLWLLATTTHAEIYYLHNDHLGNPQAVTDENRNIVWQGEYSPFGELVTETGTLKQPHRFPGQHADPETGLYYNYFRDYDPSLGRYVQSDPIGLRGGINTYAYVGGNPVNFVDPTGEVALPAAIPAMIEWCALNPVCREAARKTGEWCAGAAGAALGGWWGASNEASTDHEAEPSSSYPDRDLPRDEYGNPTPEPDAEGPHSQLGQKDGRNGKYDQAREFDSEGKPVRDIDFTDHGRPKNHTNPHQHPYVPNPTGGTPSRGGPQPL